MASKHRAHSSVFSGSSGGGENGKKAISVYREWSWLLNKSH